ncbi:MAG: hypothetical protein OSB70_16235 [Myxococcota bacterium]|nr:hypothetical protein [Myxococcota bacterium]
MEFIEGFAWPVPRALAGAVSACRFEQGDTVYSESGAYGVWPGGREGLGFAVQVLDPPKSARALAPGSEGSRFEANWNSAVELELTEFGRDRVERWVTTQGRLFCCLWRGDEAQLEARGEAPEPPLPQRELHRRLEEALPAALARLRTGRGQGARGPASLYLAAVDDANEAARSKAKAVQAVLEAQFSLKTERFSPALAGLAGAEAFHPALWVQALLVPGEAPGAIEERLRGLLYGGASESGRFALARHGLLSECPAR